MLGGRRRYYRKTITTEDPEHPEHTTPRTPGASRLHTVRRATSHTPSLGYAPGEGRRTEDNAEDIHEDLKAPGMKPQ
jgi:hypothetical protein